MTPTTVLTTWVLALRGSTADPRHDVITSLGEFGNDYDTDALTRAYVDAIDAELPLHLTLALNGEVYGPADWTGDASAALRDALDAVDFGALAEQHDRTARMRPPTRLATWSLDSPDLRSNVADSLTDYSDDLDVDRFTRAYVAALDAALPEGLTLTLTGEVYGPADWPGDAIQALQDAVGEVDFWALAAQHDNTDRRPD